MLKYNRGFRKICHLSFSYKTLINDYIAAEFVIVLYLLIQSIFARIVTIKSYIVFINQDIKDVF